LKEKKEERLRILFEKMAKIGKEKPVVHTSKSKESERFEY